MIYRCTNKCIWEGKLRREGFLTPHLNSCPNHHFVPNDEEETDEQQEFTEEELLSKKYNALKKIAINKGLEADGVNNVVGMVALIMGA